MDFDRSFQAEVSQFLERASRKLVVVRALTATDPRLVLEGAYPSLRLEREQTPEMSPAPGSLWPALERIVDRTRGRAT